MLPAAPPYEGELASSAVLRCCRHFGLSLKRVGQTLFQRQAWRPGFLLPMPLVQLSQMLQSEPRDILWGHSAFPYASAYLPRKSYERAVQTALSAELGTSNLGATLQNATAGAANRRFCRGCAMADLERHGESYWRVSHNLPGVWTCEVHGTYLIETTIATKSATTVPYLLPHECEGTTLGHGLPGPTLLAVSRITLQVQRRTIGPGFEHGGSHYRGLAIEHGWIAPNLEVSEHAIVSAVRRRHSSRLRESAGLPGRDISWAATMLRPRVNTPQTTVKHVLLTDLLTSIPDRNMAELAHRPSGPTKSPADKVDALYSKQARSEFHQALKSGEILSTERLLRRAACWQVYRHRLAELPKLRQVVLEFRSSSASVKPLRKGSVLFRNFRSEPI